MISGEKKKKKSVNWKAKKVLLEENTIPHETAHVVPFSDFHY